MSSVDTRLVRYAAIAAVPCAVTSVASADTYDGYSNTPISVTEAGSVLFSAAGIGISVDVFFATFSNGFYAYGCAVLKPLSGYIAGFGGGTGSRVISTNASADLLWSQLRGYNVFVYGTAYPGGLISIGTGQHVGFRYTSGVDTVNGFIQYDLSITATGVDFTVTSWAYNINSAITMPSNSGTPAVPGLGGLAALAIGAAGVRRNRQRVA